MWTFRRASNLEELLPAVVRSLGIDGDPFQPQLVLVPTIGVRRWLTQRLATELAPPGSREGVVANVWMPLPGEFRRSVLELSLGSSAAGGSDLPLSDRWQVESVRWAILEELRSSDGGVLGAGQTEETASVGGSGRATPEQAAQIAALFDRYHLRRPEMVLTWLRGADVDALGRRLDARLAWQPRLWRSVRARIDRPSPPEVERQRLLRAAETASGLRIPRRVICFGVESPTPNLWRWLQALAADREVEVLVAGPDRRPTARGLVRSWAAVDEFQLAPVGSAVDELEIPGGRAGSTTLLGRLQARLRAGGSGAAGAMGESAMGWADGSVSLHGCAGTRRQVEVARDLIWHALNDDPSLNESDICVAVGSMNRFGPHLLAALTAPVSNPEGEPVALRCRIADPATSWPNPWADAMAAVLRMVAGRATASEFVELCSLIPIRSAWHIDGDELATVAEWRELLGMKWGLDGKGRRSFGFGPGVELGTLRYSLDRVLLGIAVDGLDLLPGGALSYPVPEGSFALAARLGGLIDQLIEIRRQAEAPRGLNEWAAWLRTVAAELLLVGAMVEGEVAISQDLRSQQEEFDRFLARVVGSLAVGEGPTLEFAELVALVLAERARRGGPQPIHPGYVSVAAASALASVPFRMVVLLGLDDDAVATPHPSSDDLIQLQPLVGDPDPRGESRRHLFDALMAASERLVVTFDDRSPTTNEATPPSFLVTELAGELEELVGRAAVSDLVSSHPLAPFDEANFLGGASFDRVALRGAIARRVERFGPDSLEGTTESDDSDALVVARRGMLVGGSSVVPAAVEAPFAAPAAIGLDALGEAVVQPLRIFAREGLDASFPAREEEISDALAISVAPLGAWATVTQAANELLLGNGDASTLASARESGVLPLGLIGQAEAARFRTASHLLASGVVWALSGTDSDGRLSSLSREEVPVEVRLPATEVAADRAEGLAILGSCRGFLTPSTFWLVSVRYSRNVCAEVLRLWVQLLALGAQGTPAAAVISSLAPGSKTDGRGAIDTLVTSLRVGLDADECASHLGWLVDRYLRACRQPVVFTPRTGVALATKGSGAAAAEWDPSFGPALGERRQLAVQAAIGDLDFDTLIETTEFAAEATDLWARVEASCEIVEAEPSFEHSSSSDYEFIEADR